MSQVFQLPPIGWQKNYKTLYICICSPLLHQSLFKFQFAFFLVSRSGPLAKFLQVIYYRHCCINAKPMWLVTRQRGFGCGSYVRSIYTQWGSSGGLGGCDTADASSAQWRLSGSGPSQKPYQTYMNLRPVIQGHSRTTRRMHGPVPTIWYAWRRMSHGCFGLATEANHMDACLGSSNLSIVCSRRVR